MAEQQPVVPSPTSPTEPVTLLAQQGSLQLSLQQPKNGAGTSSYSLLGDKTCLILTSRVRVVDP
jgi:hypothetical protein